MPPLHSLSPLTRAITLRRLFQPRVLGAAMGVAMIAPLSAQVSAQEIDFNIPAQPLASALQIFGQQANVQLLYSPDDTQSLKSAALRGRYEPKDAIGVLLKGTGLAYSLQGNTLTVTGRGTAGSVELGATNIDSKGLGMTTEGTGSYTTGATNTATRLNLSLRETPQTVSVITRQRLDDQNLNSLAKVLEQTPGIALQPLDSERVNIFSRGYAIDSYQYDGVPTTLVVSTSATPQSLSDMAIYDRIEVLRGATGLLTGAGDPSGTINLVRKRPTDKLQGYVSAGLGSWDQYRTEMDVSGPLTPTGNIRGRMVNAYQQGNSFVDYYKTEKQVYYGILEADLTDSLLLTAGYDYQKQDPRGVSFASFPLFNSNGGQTSLSRSTNPAAKWSSRKQDTLNVFYSLEQQLANDWSVKASVNQMYSKRDAKLASASWGFLDEETGEGMQLFGGSSTGWQKQTGIDVNAKGPFQLFGREHELVVGMTYTKFEDHNDPTAGETVEGREVNYYNWGNDTAEPEGNGQILFDNDTTIRQLGTYAAVRLKPTDDLSVILGGRASDYKYDSYYHYRDPASGTNTETKYEEHGEVTPYAGIVYDLTKQHAVYASYTNIFMPQSRHDINGKSLEPRTGDAYEIGLKSEFLEGRINTSFDVFLTKQDNLAEVVPGQTVIGTQNETAYRAVSGAKTRGFDAEINGEVLPGWKVAASYTHAITKDGDGERINTVAPAELAKFWTTYRMPGELDNLTVGGGVNWQSGMHFSTTPWQLGQTVKAKQDDFAVFNLMARYQFTDNLSTLVNVNNLFDKKYLSALDETFLGGYYGDPRNVMVTTKYSF
ncbi:TonB-dependent siderophore receptor [Pseudomonas syringae]|nr:TonB-dependent siderophore receptor [Pseudomonas syringae]MCQ3032206.1 TonB-dependent siderophore receptor [Pseudomonas syringae]MDG6398438.1 TonB-dependent siderophore receptor [Pseudomonas quasicaspiana]